LKIADFDLCPLLGKYFGRMQPGIIFFESADVYQPLAVGSELRTNPFSKAARTAFGLSPGGTARSITTELCIGLPGFSGD
jgi:hypothetical protein